MGISLSFPAPDATSSNDAAPRQAISSPSDWHQARGARSSAAALAADFAADGAAVAGDAYLDGADPATTGFVRV